MLRTLRPGFSGKVRYLAIDPPSNTGNRDFLYNDRFIDKHDLWQHSARKSPVWAVVCLSALSAGAAERFVGTA